MLTFILMTVFFISISFMVSLVLSFATIEDDPRVIIRIALKNFKLLFLIVLVIWIILTIVSFLWR